MIVVTGRLFIGLVLDCFLRLIIAKIMRYREDFDTDLSR
jgi:hypothetical protein